MNSAEKLDIYMQKNEFEPFLDTYTKINSKWITSLNMRTKTIKFLEEKNIGESYYVMF